MAPAQMRSINAVMDNASLMPTPVMIMMTVEMSRMSSAAVSNITNGCLYFRYKVPSLGWISINTH